MVGALSRFRLDYPNLDEHIDRFADWLLFTHSGRFGTATTRAYTSAVRSVLVRMLVGGVPPSESMRRVVTSGATAWRLFLAFSTRGGLISDGTASGALFYDPEKAQLPKVFWNRVLPIMRRHTRTALGDYYVRAGLDPHIRRMWWYARPSGYDGLKLGALLRRTAAGLYVLGTDAIDGPELPSRFRGAPAHPDLESAIYLALWSHAGTAPDPDTTPLFLAVPAASATKALRAPAPHGVWDAAGRPAGPRRNPPPEGFALLAGEAIDLAGVAPLHDEADAAMLTRASNPKWTGYVGLTPEEVEQERAEVTTIHDPRPDGWVLRGVNIAGVPPLAPQDMAAQGAEVLTAREDAPGLPVPTPTDASDMEAHAPHKETPPPAEPAEAFDSPEWPPG